MSAMSASDPMTASLPVLRAKPHAAWTLGPIDPAGKIQTGELVGRDAAQPGLLRGPPRPTQLLSNMARHGGDRAEHGRQISTECHDSNMPGYRKRRAIS